MSSKSLLRVACAAMACLAITAGVASAQRLDRRTYFTFNTPVAIPGVTLPAGTYLFHLPQAYAKDVAQVLSQDGKTAYSMFFIHPVWRAEATEKPELEFMETGYGMPIAVQTWWHPGERNGWEFVYPKDQAMRLARGIGHPVLMVEEPAGEIAAALPTGEAAPVMEAEAPSGGERLTGELAPPALPIEEPPAALPATASRTPLVGMIGLMLIAGAVLIKGLRVLRS